MHEEGLRRHLEQEVRVGAKQVRPQSCLQLLAEVAPVGLHAIRSTGVPIGVGECAVVEAALRFAEDGVDERRIIVERQPL